ncbi:MAG: hypothetical protein ACR2QL_04165 [Woeseiaceae bacterium]
MFFGRHLVGIERLRWLIGETLVVLIGVLAALAIDQAWSDRLDRQLEVEYLRGIRDAVVADINYALDYRQPGLQRKLAAIEAVAPVIRGDAALPDDIESFLTNIGLVAIGGVAPRVTVSQGAFEELLSTGKIRLITNPSIRSAIIRYYFAQKMEHERIFARLTGYPEFVLGIHPAELRDDLNLAAIESFNIDRAIAAIQSDQFETLFNREHNLALFMKSRYSALLSGAEALAKVLDAHIEELDR